MAEHWMSFVYQYIIGGLFFFFVLATSIKSGATKLNTKEGKNIAFVLTAGFIFFFVVHGAWTYLVMKN